MAALAPQDAARLRPLKTALRSQALALRSALGTEERRRAGALIVARLAQLAEFRTARVAAAYCGFGDELDTRPFLEAVLAAGKVLALPRIVRGADRLELYAARNLDEDLVPGTWGIREPDPARCARVAPGEVDFVLVPGVAFDAEGGRLGYGKGYYDRLLSEILAGNPRVRAVAAAFDVQLVDRVPMEPHDVRLDAVITESSHFSPGGASRKGG